jgi:hypothetical protein
MADAEFLFTVAEVAVALAGFAALVTIVSQRQHDAAERGRAARHFLLSLVFASLLTVAFALLPYVPLRFGLPADAAWRVSSAIFAVAWVVYVISAMRRIRAITGSVRTLADFFPTRRAAFNFALQGVGIVGLAAGAAGLLGGLTVPIYLTSLCITLYVTGTLFVALLRSLLAPEASD